MRSVLYPCALFAVLLLCPVLCRAQLHINEIMYDPDSPEPEWVEVVNLNDTAVDLRGWVLHDRTSSRPSVAGGIVPARGYAVLTRDTLAFRTRRGNPVPLIEISLAALNNGGDDVVLLDAMGNVVDSVAYESSWGGRDGVALERISPNGSSGDQDNWSDSRDSSGATPGRRNSRAPLELDLGIDRAEFFEVSHKVRVVVVNRGTRRSIGATVSLFHDKNGDGSGSPTESQAGEGVPQLEAGDSVVVFLQWRRPLLVEGEPALVVIDHPGEERPEDNSRTLIVRPTFADTGLIINEFMYDPVGEEPEWIEVRNRGTLPVDLAGWVVHDAGASRPAIDSGIVLPGDFVVFTPDTVALLALREVPSSVIQVDLPTLNNGGDLVVLRNSRGSLVDSVPYTPSWGGNDAMSLERRSESVASDDPDSWGSSLDPSGATPGRRNSLVPPVRNIGIDTVTFDPSDSIVSVRITNTGVEQVDHISVSLVVDTDGNGSVTAVDLLVAETSIPLIDSGSSDSILLRWNRPLTLEGEQGIALVAATGDERTADDTGRVVVRLPTSGAGVVINEIMFDPDDPEPEWLELRNVGLLPADLEGWSVRDLTGGSPGFPPFILPSGSYVVCTTDSIELLRSRDINSPVLKVNLPSFNNGGDAVVLWNDQGETVDSLRYESTWNIREGVSLERIASDLPTADVETWIASRSPERATPGEPNSFSAAEVDLAVNSVLFDGDGSEVQGSISNVGLDPVMNGEVVILADTDKDGRPDVELDRELLPEMMRGDSTMVRMIWSRDLTEVGEFGWMIVDVPDDARSGNDSLRFEAVPAPADSGVIINEVMYNPNGAEAEWIEFYNRGDRPVDIGGWTFQDGSTSISVFPESRIEPGSFLVVTGDTAALRAERGVSGPVMQVLLPALNNSGDRLRLRNGDGEPQEDFSFQPEWGGADGTSLERIDPFADPEGSESWQSSYDSAGATPGKSNSLRSPIRNVAVQNARFNSADSVLGCSVVNMGDVMSGPIVLTMYADLNSDDRPETSEELESEIIPPLDAGASVSVSFDWTGLLPLEGMHGFLICSDNLDTFPDDDTLRFVAQPEFGKEGLVINEVMPRPEDTEPEWVELTNTNSLPIDLSGWSIGDNSRSTRMTGLFLQPHDYLVLTSDSAGLFAVRGLVHGLRRVDLPTLNNSGDAVRLIDPTGRIADSILYGDSLKPRAGFSIERLYPDAPAGRTGSWRNSLDSSHATPGRINSVHPPDIDGAVDSIRIRAEGNRTVELDVFVRNAGLDTLRGAELILYRVVAAGGVREELETRTVPDLPYGAATVLRFDWTFQLTDEGEIALAVVNMSGDTIAYDDSSRVFIRRAPPLNGVIINEIMFDPLPVEGRSGAEYVEVFNANDRAVPLAGWSLEDGAGSRRILEEGAPEIGPGGYGVVVSDSSVFLRFPTLQDSPGCIVLNSDLGLNNTEDGVILRNPSGNVVDSVSYSSTWHWSGIEDPSGRSLERLAVEGGSNEKENWSSCVAPSGGTPGEPNSQALPQATGEGDLTLTPSRISPDGDGFEDFIRVGYRLPVRVARIVVDIVDRRGRRIARPVNNRPTGAENDLIWDGTDDNGEPLPIGLYVLVLMAFDESGRLITVKRANIVVARRL